MNITYGILLATCALTCSAQAQVFRAQAETRVETCGGAQDETQGGSGSATATSRLTERTPCGSDAIVAMSAYSDLASGYAFVAASAQGPAGANRASGTAQYTDLISVASPTDSVRIRATLTLVASAGGSVPGGSEFLFARITLGPAGEIELRGCNPSFCPDEPVVSAVLSDEFTLQRSAFTGAFPPIGVAATATLDARSGGGFYSAHTSLEVIDDSGAQINSASGVYGSTLVIDSDGDSAPDTFDVCPAQSDSNQRDTDRDGFGNRCDADLNNDLAVNTVDLGLLRQRFFGNDPDADLNGDGVVNIIDLGVVRTLFGIAPGAPRR
ncbi:MAG: hypothetical protein AB8G16_17810 [Gammaproteobacteria bacterium]